MLTSCEMQVIIPSLNEEGMAHEKSKFRVYLGNPKILVVDVRSSNRNFEIAKNMRANIFFQSGSIKELLSAL